MNLLMVMMMMTTCIQTLLQLFPSSSGIDLLTSAVSCFELYQSFFERKFVTGDKALSFPLIQGCYRQIQVLSVTKPRYFGCLFMRLSASSMTVLSTMRTKCSFTTSCQRWPANILERYMVFVMWLIEHQNKRRHYFMKNKDGGNGIFQGEI